MKTTV